MFLRLLKTIALFVVAIALLVIMTPWAILTSLMALVLDGFNKIYAKVTELLIKNGEGL